MPDLNALLGLDPSMLPPIDPAAQGLPVASPTPGMDAGGVAAPQPAGLPPGVMPPGMPPMPMGPEFPSTDPGALADIVAQALDQARMQDAMMLESRQQEASVLAQPIIDQMLMGAMQPQVPEMGGMPPMPPAGDPMQMFSQGAGPPLPPELM